VQILGALEPVLAVVEQLKLYHVEYRDDSSSEWHNEVDPAQWRELLRPFSNVEMLRVQNEELGRCLHSAVEEMPLDIMPNLQELRFTEGGNNDVAFRTFMKERQAAGHPVNLRTVHPSSAEFVTYSQS
jgi:hypothetical protein